MMEKMLRNALAVLSSSEAEINALNVFPVADGDTGTNMRLTIENGLRVSESQKTLCLFLKSFTEGALLGARGNSGVILSQLFKGFYTYLSRCAAANVTDLKNAFIVGYKTAYSAVVRPVEGTILTVCREGIEHIKNQTGRQTTVEEFLSMYIAEMKKSLSYTPEMLSVLKEAGVVDSGATGYIAIIEGMLGYLYGDVKYENEPAERPAEIRPSAPDLSMFSENSVFEYGYCMEFILQLMNAAEYDRHFRISDFISAMEQWGNSIVCVQDGMRVKVHIHTKRPAELITLSQKYGEFLTFKLENMQLQHNEHVKSEEKKEKKKDLSIIAVCDSARTAKLFGDLGCGRVINAGPSMNVSVEEIADAVMQANAANVVILPDNKNVLLAAEQAQKLSGLTNVTVVPTQSIAEGYFALCMDVGDSSDVNYRIKQIKQGYSGSATISVTVATKPYASGELKCNAGDMIAVTDDELAAVGEDSLGTLIEGLKALPDIEDHENAVIFRGASEPEVREEKLRGLIAGAFPDLEVSFIDGGSELFNWTVGLM